MEKLPISCIIVNYNEQARLEACLQSVSFCKEIILIDLGSSDSSLEIARRYKCKIVLHEKVVIGEIARYNYINKAQYDWILCADPDEVIDPILQKEIYQTFSNIDNSVASICLPIRYYFKNKMLHGTVWGNPNKIKPTSFLNRTKVIFPSQVHTAHKILDEYKEIIIPHKGSNIIHHYWIDTFSQLFEKHKRYLGLEGEVRYVKGQRYNLKQHITDTCRSFAGSFLFTKGWKDGWHGWFLSFFYAWYVHKCWIALKKYERKYAKGTT